MQRMETSFDLEDVRDRPRRAHRMGSLSFTNALSGLSAFTVTANGSARPSDTPTKNLFVALQNAINKYLAAVDPLISGAEILLRGKSPTRRIATDGVLGVKSLEAAEAVLLDLQTKARLSSNLPGSVTNLANQASRRTTEILGSLTAKAPITPDEPTVIELDQEEEAPAPFGKSALTKLQDSAKKLLKDNTATGGLSTGVKVGIGVAAIAALVLGARAIIKNRRAAG